MTARIRRVLEGSLVTLVCAIAVALLADEREGPEGNPYVPGQGMSAEDLQVYIERMQEAPQSIRGRPGYGEGIAVAAERILESDPSGSQRTFAVLALLDGLRRWSWTADESQAEVDQRLAGVAEKYRTDDNETIAATASYYAAEARIRRSDDVEPEKLPALLDETMAVVKGRELGQDDLVMASAVIRAINRLEDDGQARRYLKEFGELFAASKDSDLARYGARAVERSSEEAEAEELTQWVGKPIELTGTTADGMLFDIADYRHKVVLVDFWATWCGPCRAALPEIKSLHERYHDRGFEVVGVNLDSDLTALADFLAEEKLPWVNVVGEEKDDKMTFPLAKKYEVRGIPTTFLIDKSGVIVAVDLHGEALAQQIEKLLAEKTGD